MTLVEKMIATAFFKGYSLSFDYVKDGENTIQRRRLATVSDIKYNKDNEVLVGGCIDNENKSINNFNTYDYRQFFLDNMSDIQVFKKIDVDEIEK
tara:strand:- start:351 stop:635 length:285 start_codon:yes stop_codon:yes gene_type:complete